MKTSLLAAFDGMKIPPKVYNLRRNLFAFTLGGIAGFIPNNKSNIPVWLLGIIFAILATKIVYGDYDIGYQWSFADIIFLIVIGTLGSVGAASTNSLLQWFKNNV